jgi:hypothetical protein
MNLLHKFLHRGQPLNEGEQRIAMHLQELKQALDSGNAQQLGAWNSLAQGLVEQHKHDMLRREAGCRYPLEPHDYNAGTTQLQSGDVIQNKFIVGEEWVGLAHWTGPNPSYLDDVLIRNCLLLGSKIWASNSHHHRKNFRMENVSIVSVRNEHGIYHRSHGYGPDATEDELLMPSCTYHRMHFYGIGSQALQHFGASTRAYESVDWLEDDTPGGLVQLSDSVIEECGHPKWGARPAHTLSFRAGKNPVLVRDVLHDGTKQLEATGTLLVEGDVGQDNWQGYEREVTVQRLTAVLKQTDRPVAQFDGCGDVVLEDCHFEVESGQPWLEANNCKSLTVRNCSGDIRVKWNKRQADEDTVDIEKGGEWGS